MQQSFRKGRFFSDLCVGLMLVAAIVGLGFWLKGTPNRADWPPRTAEVHFTPLEFDASGFAPLKLAGAWQVDVDDPRFGGVSALAVDEGRLLALTDSGSLIWLPRPGEGAQASIRDVPAGPGTHHFKANRDSESLARDPAGRGWWVAFERWHQLWLYDRSFTRPLARIDLGSKRWSDNKGVEAMVADGNRLLLFPERGNEWLEINDGQVRNHQLTSRYGHISDGLRLLDGRILLVARKMALAGLAKRLVEAKIEDGSVTLHSLARIELGSLDNVEAIAAEPNPDDGVRLWMMTDNDFRRRQRTLLVALDLPPNQSKSPAASAGPSN